MILIAVAVSLAGCVAAVVLGLRVCQPGFVLNADLASVVRQTARAAAGAGVAAAVLVVVAAVSTPRTVARPVELGAGTTMLVVDLSGSIGAVQYAMIAGTMNSMARVSPHRHVGLVFFSDSAAEVLPPQTPASVLRRIARFFGPDKFSWVSSPSAPLPSSQPPPPAAMPGNDPWYSALVHPSLQSPVVHANPWVGAFDGGTDIGRGLAVARKALADAHAKHGEVILFSDLADGEPFQLNEELLRDNRAGLRMRVVPLGADDLDLATWRRMTGPGSVIENPFILGNEHHDRFYGGPAPTGLIPIGIVFALLAGFIVWWRAPLRLKEAAA